MIVLRALRARGIAAALVATCLALLPAVLLAGAGPAAAHDELLSSDPSEAGVLAALPSRAILTFSGPVSEVREVTVTGPGGSVANGAPTSVGAEVRQNLWAGPDGSYTMTYAVVSADGHEVSGEVRFEVGDTAGAAGDGEAGASPDSSSTSGSDRAVRGVVVPAAVVLLSGAAALALWHRRRTPS
jgi:methionine-rich copper-binding protein CopC